VEDYIYGRENNAEREVAKRTQFHSAVSLKLDNSVPHILQMEHIFSFRIHVISKVDEEMSNNCSSTVCCTILRDISLKRQYISGQLNSRPTRNTFLIYST
jgi:hypothetical protein